MRSLMGFLGVWFVVLLALGGPPAVPDGGEVVLLDTPRGAWVASVRADAAFTVLEERDGWRRVRVEGWTTGEPSSPSTRSTETPAAGATVTGVLTPPPGAEPGTVGAGLVVLLVADLDNLEAEHRKLGEECRSGAEALESRITDREAAFRTALNSSDNFTTAAHRHDKAKSELALARKEKAAYVRRCQGRADDLFAARAVARAISDANGRYEFPNVATGRYWVVVGDHLGAPARAWWLDCRVSGEEGVVLDPRSADWVGDLYWGLR